MPPVVPTCVPTCSHLTAALNLPQGAPITRGALWRMGMGWEQLEQPGAAAPRMNHHVRFGRFSLPSPSMSHAKLESENGDLGGVCGGIRGT